MSDYKDLSNKAGVDKLKELIEAADICMFVTDLNARPSNSRPMSTQKVDDDGNIWFLSKVTSDKNDEIEADSGVQLFYSNKSSSEYLSVYGEAEIIVDVHKTKEIWTPLAKVWFTEGPTDPLITIIKVKPIKAHYWDTKSGKLVSLLKMGAALVTGTTMDDGIQGKIKV